MYVIYIDVLFGINCVMDLMIFYCVTLILNKHIKFWRIIIAGLIGALVYCMMIVLPILQSIPYAIYALLIPVPCVLYLYRPTFMKDFIKYYLCCMLVAAIFGGIVFNLWYTFGQSQLEVQSLSVFCLVGIGLVISISFYGGFYYVRRRFIFSTYEYHLKLINHHQEVSVEALLDTGNLLYTPITHEPVMVVEYSVIKPLLSKEQSQNYESARLYDEEEIEEYLRDKKRRPDALIPFNSVGCKQGFLWGFRIDEVRIKKMNSEKVLSRCIVAISNEVLFSDQHYGALLHPEFILGEETAA